MGLFKAQTNPLATHSSLPFWELRCLLESRTFYQFLSHAHSRQLGFEYVSNEPFGLLSPEIIILHLQQSLLHSLPSCSTVQLLVAYPLLKDGIAHCPSPSLIASCLGQKAQSLILLTHTKSVQHKLYPHSSTHSLPAIPTAL